MTTLYSVQVVAPGWAGKPLYRGHAGARELAAEWMESFNVRLGGVCEITDGLIRKVKFFFSWEEALEAARVEEEVQ